MAKSPNVRALDDTSNAMIYDGVGVAQLARLFGRDAKGVPARIRTVEPVGMRGGYPIWLVKDVAPFLVQFQGDPTEILKRMNHKDLPTLLSKDFWGGQLSRLKFEEEDGDLWPTDQIVEMLGEIMQAVRMAWMTLPDAVEAATQMSDRQRAEMRRIADAKLEEIRVTILGKLAELRAEEVDIRDLQESAVAGEAPLPEDREEDEDF